MPTPEKNHPTQHIGGTILVVMMEVDPAHEDDFNRWYDDEHLPERLELPGYISARRFKLEEGEGVLKYLSPELTCRLHTVAAAAGTGAEDLAVVITQLERLAGLTRSLS